MEVLFTPTIPHCSMATLIGLCIRVKLLRSLSLRYKIDVRIFPGTHQSEDAGNTSTEYTSVIKLSKQAIERQGTYCSRLRK